MPGKIDLTPEEQSLADQIEFSLAALARPGMDRHEVYRKNESAIPPFLKSIIDRGAVPAVRISYFTDPDYNLSRIKGSNKQLFERNGCRGSEIYTHPHFLPYLRFMVFGADLPPQALAAISDAVGDPEYFSGGDLDPVRKVVRQIVRDFGRRRIEPEEVFKHAIDIGLNTWMARSLRDAAMSVR